MRPIHPIALSVAAAMLYVSPLHAEEKYVKVEFTPEDLANRKIQLIDAEYDVLKETTSASFPLVIKVTAQGQTCNLQIIESTKKKYITPAPKGDQCLALWGAKPETMTFKISTIGTKTNVVDKSLSFNVPDKFAKGETLKPKVLDQESFEFANLTSLDGNAAVYFRNPESKVWVKGKEDEPKTGKFKIPTGLASDNAPVDLTAYANFDASGKVGNWTTVLIKASNNDDKDDDNKDDDNKDDDNKVNPTVTPHYEDFCNVDNPNIEDTKYIVCLDLYEDGDNDALENGSGGAFRFFPETRGHILLPNRAVIVRVRHARGTRVTISMDGKRGLSKGIIDNRTSAEILAEAEKKGEQKPTQIYSDVVSEVSFGPRLPGESDIKVVLENVIKGAISTYRTEVTVEELYIGAFRLGLGPVFQGAVERSYAAEVMPGSQQAQIVAKTSGTTDLELVLGFAPYLFDYYQRGGRASISRRTSYIAPYVGLGLVNAKENSLELLKSLHLGVELELSPGFSFATTFVMRRVTRLADGYHVGMPVNGPDVPTTTGYNWGWGLVANFSPEFFKVATTSSTKFFK